MPIYEWQCGEGHIFEMIGRADAVKKRQACPSCGAKSERLISTFAIHGGAPIRTSSERAAARDVDVTSLKLPNAARLCRMDDYSATRLAAHKLGRGNEFDDKMAVRKEGQNARGQAPKKAAAHKPKHSHSH
jgi:putative FmdB family regulatory protein